MKLHNKLFILALSCISLHVQSKISQVFIVNMYRKPVTININGQDVGALGKGEKASITNWPVTQPEKIKIKAQGSLTYHNGIQEEYLYLYKLNQNQNPTDEIGTITILDTNNILHFKYNTTAAPARPNNATPTTLPAGHKKPISISIRNETGKPFTLEIAGKPDVIVQPKQTAKICSNCALIQGTDQPVTGCTIAFPGIHKKLSLEKSVGDLAYSLRAHGDTGGVLILKGTTINHISAQLLK